MGFLVNLVGMFVFQHGGHGHSHGGGSHGHSHGSHAHSHSHGHGHSHSKGGVPEGELTSSFDFQ